MENLDQLLTAISDAEEVFSKEEVNAVSEGYRQYRAGNLVSHQEAQQVFDQWRIGK